MAEATRVEKIITEMVDIFLEYADTSSKDPQVSKEDFKKLLQTEIQSPKLKDGISTDDIEEAMNDMDKNHDDKINFREFSRCLSHLAKCYYKTTGKGGKKGKGREEVKKDD
ncbi:S100 calcium binding protein W [Genypterus blacodes]|uniref:S100 calcium binding protein W n=1 Tax=Genypterus blacodes TaxID=154954 RepID=UPI003F7776AD